MAESEPMSASCNENQGPVILAVSYSLLAIAIMTVILRLHIRCGLRSGLCADDYTIAISLVRYTSLRSLMVTPSNDMSGCWNPWSWKSYQTGL